MSRRALPIVCLFGLARPAAAQAPPAPAEEAPAAIEEAPAAAEEAPAVAEEAPARPEGPRVIDDATRALAKRHARKGRKAFKNGQYDRAVAELIESHTLWPLPHLLAEVAIAQAAAGSMAASWKTVRRARADAYDDKTRDATAGAADQLRDIFGETHGLLRVTSTPQTATLVLTAGQDKIEDATPFEGWVTAGRWTLQVSAAGYKDQEGTITLAPGGQMDYKAPLTSLKTIEQAKAKIDAGKKAKADAKLAAKAAGQARREKAEAARLALLEARRQAAIDAERRVAWFVVGSGAAVVAGGFAVGGWASSAEDDLNALKGSPHRRGEIDAAYDQANATTQAANALITLGVGVIAGGGWLLFTAGDGVKAAGSL